MLLVLSFAERKWVVGLKIKKLNRAEALRYMGYKNTSPDEQILKMIDECEKELLAAVNPKYLYKFFGITHGDNFISVNDTSLVFKGNDICQHLKGCEHCVLLCATLSSGADTLIRTAEAVDMTRAVITDCLASAAIEQVCNQAEAEIKSLLENYNFTWRFSPGYGDFPIEVQHEFVQVLDAQKRIGLNVTDSFILVPRKSVTAVIGVSSNEIEKGKRGCVCCNMRDRCEYRKRGERCGF